MINNQVQIFNLNKQILDRIRDLELRGLVDGHLRLCHSLKEDSGPLFFVRLLPSFCNDACAVIEKMVAVVYQTVVDFKDLFEFCVKLEGSAANIGAFRVSKACSNLCLATDKRSKNGCLLALNEIKYEYDALRTPLETILQLERDIIRMENQNNNACACSNPNTKF